MQGVALHSRPDATGEIALRVLVLLLFIATDRYHVTDTPIDWIDRRENVIEQRPFVEIRIRRIGADREQLATQFHHVVHIACLGRAPVDTVTQPIRRSEILVQSVSAAGIRVMPHHAVPEERCRDQILGVAGVLVACR